MRKGKKEKEKELNHQLKAFVRKMGTGVLTASVLLSTSPAMAAPVRGDDNVTAGQYAQNVTQTGSISAVDMEKNSQFNLYQLFTGNYFNAVAEGAPSTGDVDLTSEGFGDIQFANDQVKGIILNTLKETGYTVNTENRTEVQQASDTAKMIASIKVEERRTFANKLANNLVTAGIAPVKTASSDANGAFSVTNLTSGYYLLISDPAGAAYQAQSTGSKAMTTGILATVGSGQITVHGKTTTPTLQKDVKDPATGGWDEDYHKFADAGLIENKLSSLTYKLTGTLPSNFLDYEVYQYAFRDTLPEGIDVSADELANENAANPTGWKVKTYAVVNGIQKNVSLSPSITNKGKQYMITWSTDDILGQLKASYKGADLGSETLADAKIYVEYSPVYDQNDINNLYGAVSSLATPDINRADLEFSNNPYTGGHGNKGTTPEDENRVYDYNLVINKVDEKGQSLAGAEFELTETATGKVVGRQIVDDSGAGKFTFVGLNADVEYTLTETKVPTGMTRIDPIKFTISAQTDMDTQTVTSVSTTFSKGFAGMVTENGDGMCTMTANDATVTAVVVNRKGPNMPLTGQGGMWAAVAFGGLLIGTGVVVLNRKKKEEEKA